MLLSVLVIIIALWAVVLGFLEGIRGASWYSAFSTLLIGLAMTATGFLLSPNIVKLSMKDAVIHQAHFWLTAFIMVWGVYLVAKSLSCAFGTACYRSKQALAPKAEATSS